MSTDEPFTVTMQGGLRERYEQWLASFGWEMGRIPETDMWITTPGDAIARRWADDPTHDDPNPTHEEFFGTP